MNIVAKDVQLGAGKFTVMVKDSIDIQGFQTVAGSKALEHVPVAAQNAVVVDRILAADCQITAKTNLHELAFGITGINRAFGTALKRGTDCICGWPKWCRKNHLTFCNYGRTCFKRRC